MTFSEQFKDIFNMLCEKIGIVVDWTQENIIPYLTELVSRLVTYKVVSNAIGSVIFSGLLIFGIVGTICVLKDYNKCDKTRDDTVYWQRYSLGNEPTAMGWVMLVAAILSFITGFIGAPICISELLKWIIIPEFKIVQMISNYVAAV